MRFIDLIIVINIHSFWLIFDLRLVIIPRAWIILMIVGTFDLNLTPDKRTILLHDEQSLIKELTVHPL